MQSNWAAEHLQVIRTLMERSAVYRRALAPIMSFLGVLGVAGGIAAWQGPVTGIRSFAIYWLSVCGAAITGAYLMARRQALRADEDFWSPPTRRVTQALMPPLTSGFVTTALLSLFSPAAEVSASWLPPIWMLLYGCALHAAGFFMPRGMKLFGWIFVALGCGWSAALSTNPGLRGFDPNLVMAGSFGLLHLAYGVYLFFTERRKQGV